MRRSGFRSQKIIILFAVLGIFISGCQQKQGEKAAQEIIPVRVFKVELRDLDDTIDYVGNIKAKDEAIIYPKVTGKIIEKVKEDGSPINKGEAICYIDRDEVGLKFERAPVESTLTGVVGRVLVDIGQNVTPQTAVALVVSADKVTTNLDIPEKYLPKLSLGQEAKIYVDAYPQEEFLGVMTKISPVVDLDTRSAPVEITIDNAGHRLQSGMFSKVKITLEKRKGIPVIMKEAIMGKDSHVYIYVVENKKAALKKVTLGIRQGQYYEVKEGLRDGDVVVIMGQQRLYDGAQVSAGE